MLAFESDKELKVAVRDLCVEEACAALAIALTAVPRAARARRTS
jgi:hypothetical protein